MNKYVVIVAGGKGLRMGTEIPKQFLQLLGKPVLMHTISAFNNWNPKINIIVVLPESQQDYWKQLIQTHNFNIPHQITTGGETRFHSVSNGLNLVPLNTLVGIHDAVRPLVSKDSITRCFDEAEQQGNAIPFIPINDSLRILEEDKNKILDRSKVVSIQTPQVFQSTIIKTAFDTPYQDFFTDDASVLEYQGHQINLVKGNPENIKITTPSDLNIAEILIGN